MLLVRLPRANGGCGVTRVRLQTGTSALKTMLSVGIKNLPVFYLFWYVFFERNALHEDGEVEYYLCDLGGEPIDITGCARESDTNFLEINLSTFWGL